MKETPVVQDAQDPDGPMKYTVYKFRKFTEARLGIDWILVFLFLLLLTIILLV